MTDVFTKKKRSQVMSRIRSTDNRETEGRFLAILKLYRITGWRRHLPLVGKPDFVFPSHRVAIFIDGCFWHGCPKHMRIPLSNREYWRNKIARNIARDRAVGFHLRKLGWRIMRIWDHQLADAAAVVRGLKSTLFAPRLREPGHRSDIPQHTHLPAAHLGVAGKQATGPRKRKTKG